LSKIFIDGELLGLRVVSNFGDGDCGAGEIHTHVYARARNFEETRRKGSSRTFALACVYFARPTIAIPKIRNYSQSKQHSIDKDFGQRASSRKRSNMLLCSLYIISSSTNHLFDCTVASVVNIVLDDIYLFIYLFIYLITTHYKLHDYNYKTIQNCRKQRRGGLKETITLMLIRPPQLQFFKDGIKIMATDTN